MPSTPHSPARTWLLVVSLDHARRGIVGGFVMANHGKRPPLARMATGDGILIYSPTTTFPRGSPLRAITVAGTVTGDEPEPSDAIPGGYRRRADLREIEPLPLETIRDHVPTNRLRFGCIELGTDDATALWALIAERPRPREAR